MSKFAVRCVSSGLKAGLIYGESNGATIRPQVHAGYRYALVDDRIEDTSQFTAGGGIFSTEGPRPARDTVNLGASVRYYTATNWNFACSYDFDWKQQYIVNAGFVRAGYRF